MYQNVMSWLRRKNIVWVSIIAERVNQENERLKE